MSKAITCPRCHRIVAWIVGGTYGDRVTYYHACLDVYALVRPDGILVPQRFGWNRTGLPGITMTPQGVTICTKL